MKLIPKKMCFTTHIIKATNSDRKKKEIQNKGKKNRAAPSTSKNNNSERTYKIPT